MVFTIPRLPPLFYTRNKTEDYPRSSLLVARDGKTKSKSLSARRDTPGRFVQVSRERPVRASTRI